MPARGMDTLAIGNWPRAIVPERRRFWAVGSRIRDVMPGPGMKVEKTMPSPAGVSLVRNPEEVFGGSGEDLGDESVECGVARGGGVSSDVGVVAGVGGDGGGSGVTVEGAEVGGVEEGGAGGVEFFDEAVLEAA